METCGTSSGRGSVFNVYRLNNKGVTHLNAALQVMVKYCRVYSMSGIPQVFNGLLLCLRSRL